MNTDKIYILGQKKKYLCLRLGRGKNIKTGTQQSLSMYYPRM